MRTCDCSDSPLINPEPGELFFSSLNAMFWPGSEQEPCRRRQRWLPWLATLVAAPAPGPGGSAPSPSPNLSQEQRGAPAPTARSGFICKCPSPLQARLLLRLCPRLDRALSLGASRVLGAEHRSHTDALKVVAACTWEQATGSSHLQTCFSSSS